MRSTRAATARRERGDRRGPLRNAARTAGPRAVAPVGGKVLCDEDDLAERGRLGVDAGGGVGGGAKRIDLGQDLGGEAGALLTPEGRDGAEAADAVAALGHLHVGPGDAGGGPG